MAKIAVHYLDEDVAQRYAKAIQKATSLVALGEVMEAWQELVPDACEVVSELSEADFKKFRRALGKERRGRYMGDAAATHFGAILIPARMLRATALAHKLHVPWGTAFIRLRDQGLLDGAPPPMPSAGPGGR